MAEHLALLPAGTFRTYPMFIGRGNDMARRSGAGGWCRRAWLGRAHLSGNGALFGPARRRRLRAVLQFDFPDETVFPPHIDRGQCALEEARPTPRFEGECTGGCLGGISCGSLTYAGSEDRRLVLEGQIALHAAGPLFPPPSA